MIAHTRLELLQRQSGAVDNDVANPTAVFNADCIATAIRGTGARLALT